MPRQLDIAMGGINFNEIKMNPTHVFILDAIKNKPIGETGNFVWFITDIGIAALLMEIKILIFMIYRLIKKPKK